MQIYLILEAGVATSRLMQLKHTMSALITGSLELVCC